ncbi:unnamed protein product [Rotaria sordida]|uniref:C2 domain-containing protein n=1 Tax=Rotaria sordida TaxID=392033 RepID=A0A813MST8_9BILA|nr:unnamed protein product [Rotaria sordida]CAF0731775.1 unnamed protein product [Rotaria sordida]
MSINRRAVIDAFIERQRDNFHQLIDYLTLYYNNNIRLYFSFLSEKTNQRYLYLSILTTFILLIIIFLIIFEYHRILKYIQKFFQLIYSYKQYILLRIKNKSLHKTTPSFFNILLNSKSHMREKFFNEFVRTLNEEFRNRKEQLSVETLQFANAQIRDVSQTNNNNNSETPAEKIVINAVLDIDHLILNIVNTFREQHFSVGTSKLSGQLYILLVINPNHYSIEVNLQQVQMSPVNIIDSNNTLLTSEKQSIIKLLDEAISRTTVRCSFRLSDHQEDTNYNTLHNSAFENYPDSNKPYPSNNQASLSSVQKVGSRSRELASTRYQPQEPPPTLLVNDTNPYLYTKESELEKGPKRLLVRIVKAVKLHNVEQPYCILELNHPKQIKQTDIAKNGLNPFWDERFVFECDEQSNQLRLQIIDRKKTNQRTSNNYVDTVYADVSIPFSYATSTIYKQDIQINPQHPESIIRLEFSTLSKEEALNANNGYDAESIDDSQIWTYNDREINKIKQDYQQQYQQSSSNDFLSSSYDAATLPKNYGSPSNLYDDDVRGYGSTLPRSADIHSNTSPFSPSSQLTPRDRGLEHDKPQKSKSFMSSLKHLTLPGRKHRNKDKHDESMSSHASSISQLNTSVQTPKTNAVSHSLSSALPSSTHEYFLASVTDPTPIRRSRSISQSFRNIFRSSSRKKKNAAKADALGEYENGTHNYIIDNPKFLSTSTPTAKKLSFLHRRKSKQKNKEQTNYSTNSLSSVDCSRIESVRDTPVRANVGHPVTMTKAIVQ